MKPVLALAIAAVLATAATCLAANETHQGQSRPISPLAVSAGGGDLTVDYGFANGGTFVDNPTSGGSSDHSVAVVPSDNGGYWLIGSSDADDGIHVTPVVTEYDSSGVAQLPAFYASNTTLSSMLTIVGAVKGVNNGTSRIYVIGEYQAPGFTDSDFGVICLSPANAFQPCSGFGNGGRTSHPFDRGGTNNDFPNAIAYDSTSGSIYIAGNVDIGGRYAIGVLRMNGITGQMQSDWGNAATSDGTFVYPVTYTTNGSSYAEAITVGSPRFFAQDVFVVGYAVANSTGTDTDGVVLAIDAVNGTGFDPGWNNGNINRIFFDLGTNNKTDFLSAVSLRHNGDLLIAGQANGDSGLTHLILGEYDGSGNKRTNFCGGSGVCEGPLFNQPHPTGIAERPGAGDIVISADNIDDNGHGIQGIYQIDSRGYHLVAYDETSWTSNAGTTPSSSTNGVLVDDNDRVLEAGTRVWNSSTFDYDMTFKRWYPADSIFANSFGGAFTD